MKKESRYLIIGGVIVAVVIIVIVLYSSSLNKTNPETNVKDFLKSQGYEVLETGVRDNGEAFVKMRSFGSREIQVAKGIMTLNLYGEATKYEIEIVDQISNCFYRIGEEELKNAKANSTDETIDSEIVLGLVSKIEPVCL